LPSNSGGLSNGDQIFSIPILNTPTIKWRLIFFDCQRGFGHVLSFWKNKKKLAFTFFLGQPKIFDRHPMV
jgi:hypothetical protein